MADSWEPKSHSPAEALQRLIDGNRRFLDAGRQSTPPGWSVQMASTPQTPFAVVLGCSDSRTPVEILFDQGFGALFVVRIAGNIVAPSVVGSIEFAVSQFGTRLVVVMGHTRCGAISATVESLTTGQNHASKNIRSITDRIAPHIAELVHGESSEQVKRDAMRANVRASVDHLRHGSQIIEEVVLSGRVAVVGAEYELETGEVHFFETLSQ
jgi:carbonic anhydrase